MKHKNKTVYVVYLLENKSGKLLLRSIEPHAYTSFHDAHVAAERREKVESAKQGVNPRQLDFREVSEGNLESSGGGGRVFRIKTLSIQH